MATVAVFGASGFVGSTLVERLRADGDVEVRPFIHSSGSAWRLGRWGIPLQSVDILSQSDVTAALEGCTHVINCTRGSADVMQRGLRHLLQASLERNVERFVHLSSVAVYAGPFRAQPIDEEFPQLANDGYGGTKLAQDRLVEWADRRGLPAVVVCPPNISGAWSPFLIECVNLMRARQMALVEEDCPCPMVDVENLVHAIRQALCCQQVDGRRIFITDADTVTWSSLCDWLSEALDLETAPRLTREAASRLTASPRPKRASVFRAVRHLASSDVRSALCQDPLFSAIETGAKSIAKTLPASVQDRLRRTSNGKLPAAHNGKPNVSVRHLAQQLRGARYSLNRAHALLQYAPPVDLAMSRTAFAAWYRSQSGYNSEAGQLLRHLV